MGLPPWQIRGVCSLATCTVCPNLWVFMGFPRGLPLLLECLICPRRPTVLFVFLFFVPAHFCCPSCLLLFVLFRLYYLKVHQMVFCCCGCFFRSSILVLFGCTWEQSPGVMLEKSWLSAIFLFSTSGLMPLVKQDHPAWHEALVATLTSRPNRQFCTHLSKKTNVCPTHCGTWMCLRSATYGEKTCTLSFFSLLRRSVIACSFNL